MISAQVSRFWHRKSNESRLEHCHWRLDSNVRPRFWRQTTSFASMKKAVEVEMLEKVFNMNYSKIFNDAEYHLKERQRDNRKPTALPNENNRGKLRLQLNKCVSKTIRVKSTLTKTKYVQLRQVVLTRLTLLNARRERTCQDAHQGL